MTKTPIKMLALRSLTASQSPTGQSVAAGASYTLLDAAAADDHARRGTGRRADAEPAPASASTKAKAKTA